MASIGIPRVGFLPAGQRDAITDVPGVRVGHHTLAEGPVQTGVTVILPPGEPYLKKPVAACTVLNGFGKSAGLVQLAELGCLETPIALTNTFSVGMVCTAQIREAVAKHADIGRDWPTVNPVVLECNDGFLNDIQALAVTEDHYRAAVSSASEDFAQGSVGAGRGMSCFQVKGGIGSASRTAEGYTVGVLVLANFGKPEQCLLAGEPVGRRLKARLERESRKRVAAASGIRRVAFNEAEKGSIIMVLATNAPLDALQLGRLGKRCGNGLARTGSVYGHGSGDIVVAFTTANRVVWPEPTGPAPCTRLPDTRLDGLFQAAADATEQAIWHALFRAERVTGRDGNTRMTLVEALEETAD